MSPPVSIVRCPDYDEPKVSEALREAIDLIGGIRAFVKRGNRVLLKPNLILGKPPEKAVTTHPSILRAMIGLVREAGGIPFVGDSPGLGSAGGAAERSGLKRVANEMGCPLIEFDRPVVTEKRKGRTFRRLEIDRSVLEADIVINLPKWKTHSQLLLTLGVKNLFGSIPGKRKALWHLQTGGDRKRFAEVLVDLYEVIQPALTVLDGVLAMEGNGPSSGNPVPIGLILASGDALSLDQVVCDLLEIPKDRLVTNQVAFERGLGQGPIEVVGERVGDLVVGPFRLPSLSSVDWPLPRFLKRAIRNALSSRPAIREASCQMCSRCIEICPAQALEKGEKTPVFDYEKCIRCYCCQEICPEEAIGLKEGWGGRLVKKVGG